MGTQRITLDDQQEQVLDTLVRSGRYESASAAVSERLRLLAEREAEERPKLAALREAARVGFDALDAGSGKSFSSIEDLESYLRGLSDQIIGKAAS